VRVFLIAKRVCVHACVRSCKLLCAWLPCHVTRGICWEGASHIRKRLQGYRATGKKQGLQSKLATASLFMKSNYFMNIISRKRLQLRPCWAPIESPLSSSLLLPPHICMSSSTFFRLSFPPACTQQLAVCTCVCLQGQCRGH